MTAEEIKNILTTSRIDPALQQRVAAILSALDMYTLDRLGAELSYGDSWIIGDHLASVWEQFSMILSGLKHNDQAILGQFMELLSKMERTPNLDDRLYMLSLVIDVRILVISGRARLSSDFLERLLAFEVSLFWYLPKEEIVFLFKNHLLFLLGQRDVVKDMEVVTRDHNWDYMNSFEKTFTTALQENTEILGASGASKTVGAWILEFIKQSSVPLSDITIVNITNFLVKNALASKLTMTEKNSLGEILKLFLWILNGTLDEREIQAYKERIKADELERFEEEAIAKIESPPSSRKLEDIRSVVRPTPVQPRSPLTIQDILANKHGQDGGLQHVAKPIMVPPKAGPPVVPQPSIPDINIELEKLRQRKIKK